MRTSMKPISDSHKKTSATVFIVIAAVTVTYSLFSVLLMSDVGQFIALPRSWIITHYKFNWLFGGINLLMMASLWYLHVAHNIGRKWWMIWGTVGVLLSIVAANVINYVIFPSKHHGANYITVQEADTKLQDHQVIYVVEINGDVRGYPQDHLEIPHIAGSKIGGEDVAMVYCGLSNFALVFGQDYGYGKSDWGVMAQVHNNLLLKDHESGELIQQITATTEFSGTKLNVYPNTMMNWASFKELYPGAKVFIYPFDRLLDPIIKWAFEASLKIQNDRDRGAAFPTLSMSDKRLNQKELMWGYNSGEAQIAFTRDFAKKNGVYRFELNGEALVLVYDTDHDIVTLFNRIKDGQEVEFQSVDFRGQTETTQLEQMVLYNGVYWMVWSHWFPDTKLYK